MTNEIEIIIENIKNNENNTQIEKQDSLTELEIQFYENIKSSNLFKVEYTKYTYKDIETYLNVNYSNDKHQYSSSLDILASYLKGQKIIYMESKRYAERRLNKLMLPAIFYISNSFSSITRCRYNKEWFANNFGHKCFYSISIICY